MRILSKKYDYYDNVSYGEGNVFVRKEEEKEIDHEKYLSAFYKMTPHLRNEDTIHFIGFCGNVYPSIELTYKVKTHVPYSCGYDIKSIFCYTVEQVEKALKYREISQYYKKYYTQKKRKKIYNWSHPFNKDTIKELLLDGNGRKISDDVFFEIGSPVFIVNGNKDSRKLTVSPILRDYGFQRLIDPYTAYQEVDMYIGGVLGSVEKDTVDISDECMKEQKGFDKWSFKTMPTKRI